MTKDIVQFQRQDQVAIVTLSKGITNAIDEALVEELSAALSEAANDSQVRGLVLSSSNSKFFSIGFDIPHLYDLPIDEFVSFYDSFNALCMQLYSLPKPTVAAITGHAIAGGCILALCCDRRLIAEGRKLMGLNEVRLGVPVPFVAESILRQLISGRDARELLETGELYDPEKLLRIALADGIEPPERVLQRSIETARMLGTPPLSAYAAIKRSRVEEVQDQVTKRLEERNRIFVEHWYSPEARRLLRAAMDKF